MRFGYTNVNLGQCAMLRIEEIEPGPGKGDWSGMALSLYSVFCVALLALGSELIKGTGTSVSDSGDSTQCNLPCNCPALKQGTGSLFVQGYERMMSVRSAVS